MEKGFQLLKTRDIRETVVISQLENKFQISLPPLYRLFCQVFDAGKFKVEEYLHPTLKEKFMCSGTYYFPKGLGENNIGITTLYSVDMVFENRITGEGYGDEDLERGLIRIADIGLGGGLFLATHQSEVDNIILSIWDRDPVYEKLTDNIFEFVRGLVLAPVKESDLMGVSYSQFYKNWGEDFWRVRESV
jgi:hypothetical protein